MISLKFAQPVLAYSDEGCAALVHVSNSTVHGAHIHIKIYFVVGGATKVLNDMVKPHQFDRAIQIATRKMQIAGAHQAHVNGVRQLRVAVGANDNHQKNP